MVLYIHIICIIILAFACMMFVSANERKHEHARRELFEIQRQLNPLLQQKKANDQLEKRQRQRMYEMENILYNAQNKIGEDEDDE